MKMTELLATYDAYDIVVVPFPFIDSASVKRRPAVVLSQADNFNKLIDSSVLAMITTSTVMTWPLDVSIHDLNSAGLTHNCHIRMKIFTLDHRLILKKIGKLSVRDQKALSQSLKQLIHIKN